MSVYVNYVNGNLYTETLPARIVEVAPVPKKNGVTSYVVREFNDGDAGFQDALDRWLFQVKGVRRYPTMPDWAKEINHV